MLELDVLAWNQTQRNKSTCAIWSVLSTLWTTLFLKEFLNTKTLLTQETNAKINVPSLMSQENLQTNSTTWTTAHLKCSAMNMKQKIRDVNGVKKWSKISLNVSNLMILLG